jgi:tRNA (cytidine/uridine-2'-O-)-methyltransferase
LHFFSTKGKKPLWDVEFKEGEYLVFGRETGGFPSGFHERYADSMVRIPQEDGPVRSLNLSTAAGIVLYEAIRQVTKRGGS